MSSVAFWILLLVLLVASEGGGQTGSPTSTAPQVSGPLAGSPTSSAPLVPVPGSDPLALEKLSYRVDSELKASQEHLAAMRDAAARSNVIFVVLGGLLSFLGIVSWLRQRRQDENVESRLRESDQQRLQVHTHALTVANNEEERRSAVHASTMELLREHLGVKIEEGRRLPGLLDLQHENIARINVLTSAVAAGAKDNVETINKMFSAIANILEFKAQEAKDVQGGLAEIKAWRAERETEELQDLDALEQLAKSLRDSRHAYVSVLRRIGPRFLKTFPPRVPCLTAPQRALTSGRLSSRRA